MLTKEQTKLIEKIAEEEAEVFRTSLAEAIQNGVDDLPDIDDLMEAAIYGLFHAIRYLQQGRG